MAPSVKPILSAATAGKHVAKPALKRMPRGVARIPSSIQSERALGKIAALLEDHTGHDFSLYKTSAMYRRIERRMGLHRIATINDYAHYLSENSQEIDLLFKELLIGVTGFFRDPATWDYLKSDALPALLAQYPAGTVLRAWVPACSTGEEAYSLAMVFHEILEQTHLQGKIQLQIFATDVDADAIAKARHGYYSGNIRADVTPERLHQFFVEEKNGYRITKVIRDLVIFAPQNIIMDPPFSRLDMIACRNLLIYLTAGLQRSLIPMFHTALNRDGLLLLGHAETVGSCTDLFAELPGEARLYRRLAAPAQLGFDFPIKNVAPNASQAPKTEKSSGNLQQQADQFLLQHLSSAAVLVNAVGDILYIHGSTHRYLEPVVGKANLNIYAMACEGLRGELANALQKAMREKQQVSLSGLQWSVTDAQSVDLTVYPIGEQPLLRGLFMIVFNEVAHHHDVQRNPQWADLNRMQDEIYVAQQKLASTNEQLQAASEEMTASQEELQSIHQKLQSVNVEFKSKVRDLARVDHELQNLANQNETATIFLDNELNVHCCIIHSSDGANLVHDRLEKAFPAIADLYYAQLQDDAREVLRSSLFMEKQIRADNGCRYRVRMMPYQSPENEIDGMTVTFSNITELNLQQLQQPELPMRAKIENRIVTKGVNA